MRLRKRFQYRQRASQTLPVEYLGHVYRRGGKTRHQARCCLHLRRGKGRKGQMPVAVAGRAPVNKVSLLWKGRKQKIFLTISQ